MKVIGFNFNKIIAEKDKDFKKSQISTNIEFIEITKENVEMLKDSEVIKMAFKFSILYNSSEGKNSKPQGEISFQGHILISSDKKESKEILDSWKKKTVPDSVKMPLLNLILKKCSVRALALEEELNLPSHVPLPKIAPKNE